MKRIQILIFFFVLISCKPSLEFVWAKDIGHGLTLKYYVSRGGVYTGNTNYYYITNSSNYRKLVGKCSDNESVFVKVNKCGVEVMKYENIGSLKKGKLIDSLCISTLIQTPPVP